MNFKQLKVLLCCLLLSFLSTRGIVKGCTDGDVRLDGETANVKGRVEICLFGVWGGICDNHWDGRDAQVACRQLGYESDMALAVGFPRKQPIHRDYLECNGDEDSLSSCPSCLPDICPASYFYNCYRDAGVICYPNGVQCNDTDIRLVGGANEGRVEICYEGLWGTVCGRYWNWDIEDFNDEIFLEPEVAVVICRQLGLPSEGAVLVRASSITADTFEKPIFLDETVCNGTEERLSECSHSELNVHDECWHPGDIGVMCPVICDDGDVRLMGGQVPGEGRVEVCFNDEYGTICNDSWNNSDAAVICHQLGFSRENATGGTAESLGYGIENGNIWLDEVGCNGEEESITECSHSGIGVHDCAHSEDVGVMCQYVCLDGEVRLVGADVPGEGRVELCLRNEYGTICDDRWDNRDAAIICHQLGFPREEAIGVMAVSLGYGIGTGSIWLDEVGCSGEEESVTQCSHFGVGVHNCAHSEDAGVLCKTDGVSQVCTDGDLILRDGRNPSEGRVELCLHDRWGTVCDQSIEWGEQETAVVCQYLGFTLQEGVPFRIRASAFGTATGPIFLNDVDCIGNETLLTDCSSIVSGCTHPSDIAVVCNDPNGTQCINGSIRLVNGITPYEGRVEICLFNVWGAVCDDSWDNVDATAVCRQLNLTNGVGVPLNLAFFGQGVGIIWLDDLDCPEDGDNLLGCGHGGIGIHNCGHNEDAGVICPFPDDAELDCENGDIELVDGETPYEGRVEICYNNQWGTICADTNWDDTDAEVVCRQLGFIGEEYLAESGAHFGQGSGPIFLHDVDCYGDEFSLLHCVNEGELGEHGCIHSQDAGVACIGAFTTTAEPTTPPTTTFYTTVAGSTANTTEKVTEQSPVAGSSSSFRIGGIAIGTALGVLLPSALLVGVAALLIKRRRYTKKRARETTLMLDELLRQSDITDRRNTYATTQFNPANSRQSLAQPQSPLLSIDVLDEVPEDVLIPSADIRLMDTLGQGEYGIVYKAHLIKPMIAPRRESKNTCSVTAEIADIPSRTILRKASRSSTVFFQDPTQPLTVAVKTLKGFFTEENVSEMIRESKKMQEFDHPNVLSMLGICLDAGPAPYIVMPFMANGSLISYLKANRTNLVINDSADEDAISTTQKRMTDMCLQIAKGMEYLASKKLIHRDLAARNCMIDSGWIIKVADFGLSESTSTKDYFRQAEGGNVKLPIKWMAPESLSDGVFSEKTDVWSFGVTCWEVFTGGMTPYRGVHPLDVISMLDRGLRLERPLNGACSDTMFSIMGGCWQFDPKDRPDFSYLVVGITHSLEALSDYLDVSTFQFSFKKEESSEQDDQTSVLSSVQEEGTVVFENTGIDEDDSDC